MKRHAAAFVVMLALLCWASASLAGQSTIVEAEGFACMGDDKTKKSTRLEAQAMAKRAAAEQAGTYIWSETSVKDAITLSDVTEAYSRATVKILETLDQSWFQEAGLGDCYKIRVRAEVTPDETAIERQRPAGAPPALDDPSAPLTVKVWTDREKYAKGERMKIYLKGNKPFYARVLYRDAQQRLIQLLPNIHRSANYFNGGVIYEIPSGNDTFSLDVQPPYGKEKVLVYASTSPLGQLDLKDLGGVYQVDTPFADVGDLTRGVHIVPEAGGAQDTAAPAGRAAAEFFEAEQQVTTAAR